jgi:hypothetical protein
LNIIINSLFNDLEASLITNWSPALTGSSVAVHW